MLRNNLCFAARVISSVTCAEQLPPWLEPFRHGRHTASITRDDRMPECRPQAIGMAMSRCRQMFGQMCPAITPGNCKRQDAAAKRGSACWWLASPRTSQLDFSKVNQRVHGPRVSLGICILKTDFWSSASRLCGVRSNGITR
jgi:hypothetical protein